MALLFIRARGHEWRNSGRQQDNPATHRKDNMKLNNPNQQKISVRRAILWAGVYQATAQENAHQGTKIQTPEQQPIMRWLNLTNDSRFNQHNHKRSHEIAPIIRPAAKSNRRPARISARADAHRNKPAMQFNPREFRSERTAPAWITNRQNLRWKIPQPPPRIPLRAPAVNALMLPKMGRPNTTGLPSAKDIGGAQYQHLRRIKMLGRNTHPERWTGLSQKELGSRVYHQLRTELKSMKLKLQHL